MRKLEVYSFNVVYLPMAEKKVTRAMAKVSEEKDSTGELQKLLFSEEFLNRFSDLVSKKGSDNFAVTIEAINVNIENLQSKVTLLENENTEMKKLIDRQEQYSRRNNIRLHGLAETENERSTDDIVVKLIREKLKLDITVAAIDRSHRIGRKSEGTGKPRQIIVKFIDYHVQNAIIRSKKMLKNTKITITEDLTSTRAALLRTSMSNWGKKNVWTSDGRIFIKYQGSVHKIETEQQ